MQQIVVTGWRLGSKLSLNDMKSPPQAASGFWPPGCQGERERVRAQHG